jgi:hypothetical protein
MNDSYREAELAYSEAMRLSGLRRLTEAKEFALRAWSIANDTLNAIKLEAEKAWKDANATVYTSWHGLWRTILTADTMAVQESKLQHAWTLLYAGDFRESYLSSRDVSLYFSQLGSNILAIALLQTVLGLTLAAATYFKNLRSVQNHWRLGTIAKGLWNSILAIVGLLTLLLPPLLPQGGVLDLMQPIVKWIVMILPIPAGTCAGLLILYLGERLFAEIKDRNLPQQKLPSLVDTTAGSPS